MKKKRVAFCTLGCKVNQYETNAMMQKFIEEGYIVVDFEENADVYVVNTCTVTNMADKKSRQMLRRVKEISPDSILVAVGCYAQVAREDLEKIPEIDLILGTNDKKDILKYIEEMKGEVKYKSENDVSKKDMPNELINIKKSVVTDVIHNAEFADYGTVTYTEKTRAVIKVQDGCDRYCSYCIIPYARGRVRSRSPENIITEISEIAKNGIKEVVITGIHIASYGKDLKEYRLIDLLEDVQKIEGIERIRLGSLEPTLITEEFVRRLSKLSKICDHFHLSLQSGCDETLKRMNRRYTTKEFEEGVNLLRSVYPNVALTTDIIVGFPGETEGEFQKTYDFLNKIAFYKMHIFKYSPRKGTKAETMPNQIDGNVKDERSRKLIELSDKNEIIYNKSYIGKELEVLLENEHIENEKRYVKGHTTNYIVVKVELPEEDNVEEYENTIRSVKIKNTDGIELKGKLANK